MRPPAQHMVTEHLLDTQLYAMHGGGVKRPQIAAVLRLQVNPNELECGVWAGGPLLLPAPQRGPRGEVGTGWARSWGWVLKGGENWVMKKASLGVVKSGQMSGNRTEGRVCVCVWGPCVCVCAHIYPRGVNGDMLEGGH